MPSAENEPERIVAPWAPFRWLVIPVLLALVFVALDHMTDLDRSVTRFFFDAHAHAFPLRSHFLLDVVMHHWAKYAVVTLGFLLAAGLVLSFVVPQWKAQRPVLVFLLLSMALAPLSVMLGKAVSARHCPWDIDEFGGLVPYVPLWEPLGAQIQAGHCFPAIHAATGFALMAFYFVAFALRNRNAARYSLALGIAAGLVLGFGRVVQGAHFVSHVLWSGLLCWIIMVLLYRVVLAGRLVQPYYPTDLRPERLSGI